MSRDLTAVARRVLEDHARGRVPSLADHFALGTVGSLDPDFAAPPVPEDGGVPVEETTTVPRTSRPQPLEKKQAPPPPQVVAPVAPAGAPVAPVEEQIVPTPEEERMAVRAMVLNPGMGRDVAYRLARRASEYLGQ